jgi:hypothetical protein
VRNSSAERVRRQTDGEAAGAAARGRGEEMSSGAGLDGRGVDPHVSSFDIGRG